MDSTATPHLITADPRTGAHTRPGRLGDTEDLVGRSKGRVVSAEPFEAGAAVSLRLTPPGSVTGMTDPQAPSGPSWRYQFTADDGTEIATDTFADDAAAETWARERSKADDIAIVIHRHSAHVEAWEYVTEVDERSAI